MAATFAGASNVHGPAIWTDIKIASTSKRLGRRHGSKLDLMLFRTYYY